MTTYSSNGTSIQGNIYITDGTPKGITYVYQDSLLPITFSGCTLIKVEAASNASPTTVNPLTFVVTANGQNSEDMHVTGVDFSFIYIQ